MDAFLWNLLQPHFRRPDFLQFRARACLKGKERLELALNSKARARPRLTEEVRSTFMQSQQIEFFWRSFKGTRGPLKKCKEFFSSLMQLRNLKDGFLKLSGFWFFWLATNSTLVAREALVQWIKHLIDAPAARVRFPSLPQPVSWFKCIDRA